MDANERSKIYRLIDANVNRCREGLRVVEDVARFILDSESLATNAKRIRHSIAELTSEIIGEKSDGECLVTHRDTEGDVGKATTIPSESSRSDLLSVIRANFIRAEESLRVLEEFSKFFGSDISQQIKSLRYDCYIIEKEMVELAGQEA